MVISECGDTKLFFLKWEMRNSTKMQRTKEAARAMPTNPTVLSLLNSIFVKVDILFLEAGLGYRE